MPDEVDHLESLRDVLKNLPAAKPTPLQFVVAMASPIALLGKAVWDLCPLIKAMTTAAPTETQLVNFVLVAISAMLSAYCSGALAMSFLEARNKKEDMHLLRVQTRVKEHLERAYMAAGRNSDGTFPSPKKS
jgi:hypothetical protein